MVLETSYTVLEETKDESNSLLDTSVEDSKIRMRKELEEIKRQKKFKSTDLPEDFIDEKESENPFLDISVRQLIDEFVLTWNKIILELLDFKRYDDLKYGEWWDKLIELFKILKEVFWVDNRLFHIGVGFIIISFFVFFICVTNK
jgi:hypothetical protein|tara:strand:+ start:1878 stop:2312 length:435 start_codon:yes stop_codon:yes gene_type:complete